jgi:hypothetical protein
VSRHPLASATREPAVHRRIVEVELGLLGEDDVRAYLAGFLAGGEPPPGVARAIHRRTDGHAMFMVEGLHSLAATGGPRGPAIA